ncbi:MAG: lipid-binding SYLF domain-containing protein [Bryobacterales bacterium]|nr:lipid-binding SYLF domain-containing protein [Bryobacteraceae bacterium]MDW8129962.1 lipid-binding SYLF domain-containing protein [Bryobacterales bacterium]
MRTIFPVLRWPAALAVVCALHAQQARNEDAERLERAAVVFQEIMDSPDKGIPQELLNKAHCAVIVPGLKKGAFIIGAKYGRGFVSCRSRKGVGWTAPAAVRIEGGSFGLQIGGSEIDVIMLVMNERGAQRLLSSKFTLGGDASVAAGPVGRTAAAQTDAYMTAEILSWSRSRGLFAGVSLHGATLRQDLDVNRRLYGKTLENREIIESEPPPPAAAKRLMETLNKHSSRKS